MLAIITILLTSENLRNVALYEMISKAFLRSLPVFKVYLSVSYLHKGIDLILK